MAGSAIHAQASGGSSVLCFTPYLVSISDFGVGTALA